MGNHAQHDRFRRTNSWSANEPVGGRGWCTMVPRLDHAGDAITHFSCQWILGLVDKYLS